MAIYSTDFSSNTLGTQPSDWYNGRGSGTPIDSLTPTSATIVADPTTGYNQLRLLVPSTSSSAAMYLMYTPVNSDANRANVETLMLSKFVAGGGDIGSVSRFTYGTQPTHYTGRNRDMAAYTKPSAWAQKTVSNVFTDLTLEALVTTSSKNDWVWTRTRVNGTTIQYKAWKQGTAEPASWKDGATDSSITGVGAVGLNWYKIESTVDLDVRVAYFAAGTNGDTVPLPTFLANKTQSGRVRVKATQDRTTTGRVSVYIPEPDSGSTAISGGVGTFAMGAMFGGIAAWAGDTTADKPQTGQLSVRGIYDKTQGGRLRISGITLRNQTGRLRITGIVNRTQSGRLRISSEPIRAQSGRVRVSKTLTTTQQGRVRISVLAYKTQSGRLRVYKITDRTIGGRLAVLGNVARTQLGRLRVQALLNQTQSGRIRIQATLDRVQTGKLNIIRHYTQTQSGAIRVYNPIIDQGGYIPQWPNAGPIEEAENVDTGTVIPTVPSESVFEQADTPDTGTYTPQTIEKGNF